MADILDRTMSRLGRDVSRQVEHATTRTVGRAVDDFMRQRRQEERGSLHDVASADTAVTASAAPLAFQAQVAGAAARVSLNGQVASTQPAATTQPKDGPVNAKLEAEIKAFINGGVMPPFASMADRRAWFERANAACQGNLMVSWCAKHGLYEANERKDWDKHKQILGQAEEILAAIYGRDALNRYKTTINQGLLGRIDMHKAFNRIDGFKPDLREDVLDIAGIWRGISLEKDLCASKETSLVLAAGRDVTTVALKNNLGHHPVIQGRVAMATLLTDQIQAIAQDPNLSQERQHIEIEGLVRESYQSKSAALYLLQDRIAKGQVINPATKQPYTSVDEMFQQIYQKPGGNPDQALKDAKAALGLFPQN